MLYCFLQLKKTDMSESLISDICTALHFNMILQRKRRRLFTNIFENELTFQKVLCYNAYDISSLLP